MVLAGSTLIVMSLNLYGFHSGTCQDFQFDLSWKNIHRFCFWNYKRFHRQCPRISSHRLIYDHVIRSFTDSNFGSFVWKFFVECTSAFELLLGREFLFNTSVVLVQYQHQYRHVSSVDDRCWSRYWSEQTNFHWSSLPDGPSVTAVADYTYAASPFLLLVEESSADSNTAIRCRARILTKSTIERTIPRWKNHPNAIVSSYFHRKDLTEFGQNSWSEKKVVSVSKRNMANNGSNVKLQAKVRSCLMFLDVRFSSVWFRYGWRMPHVAKSIREGENSKRKAVVICRNRIV